LQITYKLLDHTKDEIPYELLLLADPSKKLIQEYLERGYCYLANINEELVGEFVLIQHNPHTYEIINIAVKEEYQGRGIGKHLIEKAIEEAKKLEARSLEIGTGNSSVHQLRMYQKSGFKIIGIDHDFFVRNYEDEIYEDGIQCRDMIRLRIDL